jgi:hypothetical protein
MVLVEPLRARTRSIENYIKFNVLMEHPPLVGYETLAMMRKGQVKEIDGKDIVAQAAFVNALFDIAA